MRLELRPVASPEVEQAVREALDAARLGPALRSWHGRGEWCRTALDEGVERDPGYASPRISRGATRA